VLCRTSRATTGKTGVVAGSSSSLATHPTVRLTMKILTEEQAAGHNVAIFRGAAEGLLGSVAFVVPTSFLLNRRWTYYRSLPLPLKVFGTVMIIAPLTSIQAERRGLEFDREVNWFVRCSRPSSVYTLNALV